MSKIPIHKSGKTSQCWQDKFVYDLCKDNGTYIEIGGSWPIKNSNTYSLEKFANYKGFSVELDKIRYADAWKRSDRKNIIYWGDAIEYDYKKALFEQNMNIHVNYLSCDIEPPENTFQALKNIIQQGISFDVITFEHDLYNSPKKDFNILAIDFLKSFDYKIAVYDVYHKNKNNIFETWFVKNSIDFKTMSFEEWKSKNI